MKKVIVKDIRKILHSEKYNFKKISLEVGLAGAELCFVKNKDFGNRILKEISFENNIYFLGIEEDVLKFKSSKPVELLGTASQQRGYGLGKYQGD